MSKPHTAKARANPLTLWSVILLLACALAGRGFAEDPEVKERTPVRLLYIPLADHYAALVAYERYREHMQFADLSIAQMGNWDLLRAYFLDGQADMACVMGPLALDMFREQPSFRWIGLMHRDGNALAVNEQIASHLDLSEDRTLRKPDAATAEAIALIQAESGRKIHIGVPHLQSTHSVVLYRYLKENGARLTLNPRAEADALAITIAPPKSPIFLRARSNRKIPAAFEQSLPWADIVETSQSGQIAWYSKDVMPWPGGHVECIAIASDQALDSKFLAVQEVMRCIDQAGRDIERAREEGGQELQEIIELVRKHIPAHTKEAIAASLHHELRVINYHSLQIDKPGLQLIMDYAVEGGILKEAVDLDDFADPRFLPEIDTHAHSKP